LALGQASRSKLVLSAGLWTKAVCLQIAELKQRLRWKFSMERSNSGLRFAL